MMPDPTVTVIDRLPNAVVVHIQAEQLDEGTLKAVRGETTAAAAAAPTVPVVLDMQMVKFMASLSLGGLVQLSQAFKSRNQRLVFANLQPAVRETIAITRLDRLFEIVDDLSGFLSQA
jgi:anti-anti-sigma factor